MDQTIATLNDFFDFLKKNNENNKSHVFRGVKTSAYKLIPSIGRYCKSRSDKAFTIQDEITLLKSFKMKAFPYLDKEYSILELLSLAQHHGLPTRLLDWTWNPLVAFYFAVRNELNEGDSLVYYWEKNILGEYEPSFDPFAIEEIKVILPPHLTNRIIAQSSIFTIHNDPNNEFESENIIKVIIKNEVRKDIKRALNLLGIHEASMFPDIVGIASYTKWLKTKSY